MKKKILDYILMTICSVLVLAVVITLFVSKSNEQKSNTEFKILKNIPTATSNTKNSITPPAAKAQNAEEVDKNSKGTELREEEKLKDVSKNDVDEKKQTSKPAQKIENTSDDVVDIPKIQPMTYNAPAPVEEQADIVEPVEEYVEEVVNEYVEEISEVEAIPFDTEYRETDSLLLGQDEVFQVGENGEVTVRYSVLYRNGELVASEEIGREITKEPLTYIILVGTKVEEVQAMPLEVADQQMATQQFNLQNDENPASNPKPNGTNSSGLGLMAAGSNDAVAHNIGVIASLFSSRSATHYANFSDNGDGTITVDGVTFNVNVGATSYKTTSYDGYACAQLSNFAYGECNPTASGVLAQLGVVAVNPGSIPFGTVVFVEGYGLGVVGDYHGMGNNLFMDLGFDPKDCENGLALPTANRNVYILSTP